jgi:hypothetical protein
VLLLTLSVIDILELFVVSEHEVPLQVSRQNPDDAPETLSESIKMLTDGAGIMFSLRVSGLSKGFTASSCARERQKSYAK